ncbi:uncharacterized protein B0I36DRAFT_328926 [Microdochium trichocladiopsis]|uniref:Uncharacterized protein n=1 Tax=Microdochium trichocladiopsis TaxID=1682393 RepID=A0A9P9BQB3_9PEZI|nr:uncharacterized protein B0I36DRAFT_328926 [Microdochium trichocladiopsis]KAH7025692.1 hypothetical protein B0I36DRAFT_328926 [Microdochium trichocladiopsis]
MWYILSKLRHMRRGIGLLFLLGTWMRCRRVGWWPRSCLWAASSIPVAFTHAPSRRDGETRRQAWLLETDGRPAEAPPVMYMIMHMPLLSDGDLACARDSVLGI